jgi:hypothetical protein
METIRIRDYYIHATMTIGLTPGGNFVGFGGAALMPSAGEGALVEQVVMVQFKGTQAEIEAAQALLGRALEDAAEQATRPAGRPVYLECQVESGGEFWRSQILSGRLELVGAGVDQRPDGKQAGKLILQRANWWEACTELTLFANQTVYNHYDSHGGHRNWAEDVMGPEGDQDLPGSVRLVYSLVSSITAPLGMLVSQAKNYGGFFYEGEEGVVGAGVTGTLTADANGSEGNYFNLAWNGSTETRLWHMELDTSAVGAMGGGTYRPVIRLGASISVAASEKMWARWEIVQVFGGSTETVVYESPGAYLEPSRCMLFGPALMLPPWSMDWATTAPVLRLVLKVTAAGGGAHALALDWVDFAPLDGWRQYEPVAGNHGINIEDRGQMGMAGPVGAWPTHSIEGPGFQVWPLKGRHFAFYLYTVTPTGQAAHAGWQGQASAYYRPRRRML